MKTLIGTLKRYIRTETQIGLSGKGSTNEQKSRLFRVN